MFARRRARGLDDDHLVALAATMNEGMSLADPPDVPPGSALPAGYTYLGQLIDHDLTSDRRLFQGGLAGATPIQNFRTPQFDLDCLYGDGPESGDADLYDPDRLHLRVATHDLARRPDGRAHIKDPRNDSNRIVSQLHLAFARFHNRVVDDLGTAGGAGTAERFASARTVVRRHYQWVVLHDFLRRIVSGDLVDSILGTGAADARANLKLLAPSATPKMPFEFSAAAFRFGHSMVRSAYELNSRSGQILVFDRAQPTGSAADDLRGFRPMPESLAIEWDHFFPMPGADPLKLQPARPIDTLIARPLFELPVSVAQHATDKGRRLPYRNLHRGETDLTLPTGQEVALEMRHLSVPGAATMKILGPETPFQIEPGQLTGDGESEANLGGTGIGKAELEGRLNAATPLWYYVLKEAAESHGGHRLGPVGGRIVAEVVISLMLSKPDGLSILEPAWRPTQGEFGCKTTGAYRMVDFLGYAGSGSA